MLARKAIIADYVKKQDGQRLVCLTCLCSEGGHDVQFEPIMKTDADIERLHTPEVIFDRAETDRRFALASGADAESERPQVSACTCRVPLPRSAGVPPSEYRRR